MIIFCTYKIAKKKFTFAVWVLSTLPSSSPDFLRIEKSERLPTHYVFSVSFKYVNKECFQIIPNNDGF